MSIRSTAGSSIDKKIIYNTTIDGGVLNRELIDPLTIVSDVLTVSYSKKKVVSVSSPAANFTINLTSPPTTNNSVINLTLIVTQGATGRIPNVFQIDGAAQTLRWVGGVIPTATNSKIDVFSFSVIRQADTWTTLGQASLNF